jgi:hypothetical protein
MPITRKILPTALAIAAVSAPATAAARPPAEPPHPPRGAIVIPPGPPRGAIVIPSDQPRSSGFDWPDAGVGAGMAIFIVAAGSAWSTKKAARRAASQ